MAAHPVVGPAGDWHREILREVVTEFGAVGFVVLVALVLAPDQRLAADAEHVHHEAQRVVLVLGERP